MDTERLSQIIIIPLASLCLLVMIVCDWYFCTVPQPRFEGLIILLGAMPALIETVLLMVALNKINNLSVQMRYVVSKTHVLVQIVANLAFTLSQLALGLKTKSDLSLFVLYMVNWAQLVALTAILCQIASMQLQY